MNADKTWLDYLVAIGAVSTPVLVLAISGIGWKLRKSIERQDGLDDKLRNDRIETYNIMLEPFILMSMTEAAWLTDKNNRGKNRFEIASAKMHSIEYRKASFKLSLVANDSVVRAYNELMQFLFAHADDPTVAAEKNAKIMFGLLGDFLLGIRKSMGNELTKLNNWQMIEWFLVDARKYQNESKNAQA